MIRHRYGKGLWGDRNRVLAMIRKHVLGTIRSRIQGVPDIEPERGLGEVYQVM